MNCTTEKSTLEKIGYTESYVRACNPDGWSNVVGEKGAVVRKKYYYQVDTLKVDVERAKELDLLFVNLIEGRIKPSEIIGTGFKNPRMAALEYLYRQRMQAIGTNEFIPF